jgi:Golgi nucleoside diphosphatase
MEVLMQSRGLGDDIKKITSATGLDQIAKRIAQLLNEDCGCDDRQKWVNEKTKLWPMYKNRNKDK